MRLSDRGRALIKAFEGLSLKAYPDTEKGYSIGYGHFGAKPGDVITHAEADRLFDLDAQKYESGVTGGLQGARTEQHQFDAFVSLAYNIGLGGTNTGFLGSTALRLHRQGDYAGAANALILWNKSDGGVNPVLVKRRAREREIYLFGYGGAGAAGGPSPAPAPPATPSSPELVASVDANGRIIYGAAKVGAGGVLVVAAALFFCPHCSEELDRLEVRGHGRREKKPAT